MTRTVHVIGAGLAGLSTALELQARGERVIVYEAAPQAGGRCRAYEDKALGVRLDNGNHLVMSGNLAAMAYLRRLHGDPMTVMAQPAGGYTFVDMATQARWSIQPSHGRIPWWLFNAATRVPETKLTDYASLARMLLARSTQTVANVVAADHPLYRSFWEPLTIAALNTEPQQAAAKLMQPVLLRTFAKGWDFCRPLMARFDLGRAFIDPAVAAVGDVRFGARLKALQFENGRVTALSFGDMQTALGPHDAVVLAVPAWIAPDLLPDLVAPPEGEPIVNVHYKLPHPLEGHHIVGVLGGLSQWVFGRDDIASVTISAASRVEDRTAEDIAAACWPEVQAALGLGLASQPAHRVVKERRATFAQTPHALKLRPAPQTRLANLVLAGDWVASGLPATIEGAIQSGVAAAALLTQSRR
jgi:hydroxysqualene dehydroxylase